MDNSVFLEFNIVDDFLWKVNKDGYYKVSGMTLDGDDFNFIPVSSCKENAMENIDSNGRLNSYAVPLNKTSSTYPSVKLVANSVSPCGLIVSVGSATNTLQLGADQQNLKGIFVVHSSTDTVLAYCILPESVAVRNYLTIPYSGALIEIKPVTHLE